MKKNSPIKKNHGLFHGSLGEVEALSSSYLERKIGNLVFSIPAGGTSIGLNHVVPFLQSSESWHGLVSRPATEASQESVFIRPKIGGNYTRNSLRFLPIQADVAFNTTVGNEVTFKPSGVLLGLGSKQLITSSWLPEETVNGRIQKVRFVPAVRERSFSVESRRELLVETKYGLLTLADLKGISRGLDVGDEISCQCFLTATFGRGDFVGKQNLVAQVYSVIQGALTENKPEKFARFFLKGATTGLWSIRFSKVNREKSLRSSQEAAPTPRYLEETTRLSSVTERVS